MAIVKRGAKLCRVIPENKDEKSFVMKFNENIPFTGMTGQWLVYSFGKPEIVVKTIEQALFWKSQIELQCDLVY